MTDEAWLQTLLAPNFRVADWYALRDRLVPGKYDRNWAHVIAAIRRRFTKRFIEPVDALIARERRRIPEGPGFAVLAIDCLLIEMLVGYQQGRRTRFRETGDAFLSFLTGTPRFKEVFTDGDRAASFGRSVRNGILHDGETRQGWIVWKGLPDGPLLATLPDGRMRLYRDAFHAAVKAQVAGYFARLREK